MIASLTGVLTFKSTDAVVVEVNGVGYQVHVPLTTFYRLPELKQSVSLHTHTYLREEGIHLYGFISRRERQLFLQLLGVSGIGPRMALNILSGIEVDTLIDAIRREDAARLHAIPGIGKKTAARVLLELREKLGPLSSSEKEQVLPAGPADDALSALVNLGYPRAEAKTIVDQVAGTEASPTVEVLIKGALKKLNRA